MSNQRWSARAPLAGIGHGFTVSCQHEVAIATPHVEVATSCPQQSSVSRATAWTRCGSGRVADKERSLAAVLVEVLPAPEHWDVVAARYLEDLDALAGTPLTRSAELPVEGAAFGATLARVGELADQGSLAEAARALMSALAVDEELTALAASGYFDAAGQYVPVLLAQLQQLAEAHTPSPTDSSQLALITAGADPAGRTRRCAGSPTACSTSPTTSHSRRSE